MRAPTFALTLLAAFLLAGGVSTREEADDMPLPPSLQAAVFKKIFAYDRTLKAKGAFEVLVVHGEDLSVAESMAGAFGESGIAARTMPVEELSSAGVDDSMVLYVTPGVDAAAVEPVCTGKGVLSVSGVPELAMSGEVAIGIGTRDQKPEILVHLRRLKAEGHELDAMLLDLARVIR